MKSLGEYKNEKKGFNKDASVIIGSSLMADDFPRPFCRSNDQTLAIHQYLFEKARQETDTLYFRPHPKGALKQKILDAVPDTILIDSNHSMENVVNTYGTFYFETCGSAWFEVIQKKHDDQIVYATNLKSRPIQVQMLSEMPPNVFFI